MHSAPGWQLNTFLAALMLAVAVLTGCGNDAPPQADASEQQEEPVNGSFQPREADGVDVVYFEESDPCDCMAEVGDAVEHSIQSNFAQELESGELRFFLIVSDDPANGQTLQMFDAQTFDLFIIEYVDGEGTATPVYEIWNLMGDDEAIESLVKAQVEAALAEQR